MRIQAHIVAFNEQEIIDYTLRHYTLFCTKVFVYNNMSTDKTVSICKKYGKKVEVIDIDTQGKYSDKMLIEVKNNRWKNSIGKCDWVIVGDCDELLFEQNLPKKLWDAKMNNYSIIKTQGYNMYSNRLPMGNGQIYEEINEGVVCDSYSKSMVFDPNKIYEINYDYGCHTCKPKGKVKYSDFVLKVLHYKNIGGIGRLIARNRFFESRMKADEKAMGLSVHYTYTDQRMIDEFNDNYNKKVKVL